MNPISEIPAPSAQRRAAAQQMMEENTSISASPPVAFQIFSLLRQPDYSNDDLIDLVQLDPKLTAQLLRLVNSAQMQGRGTASLADAVNRLGTAEIANQAMSLSLGQLITAPSTSYCPDPAGLWRHSVECGLVCRHLSNRCDGLRWDEDLAFTGGLLHDLGKMVINSSPAEAMEVMSEIMDEEGLTPSDAELAVFGADHAEIGGLILEQWQLPMQLANAVRFHHAPEFDRTGLATLIHVGNRCTRVNEDFGWDDFQASLQPYSLEVLGLSQAVVEECWGEVVQNMDTIERYMTR